MALGKNLKKQQLIPDEEKEDRPADVGKKVSSKKEKPVRKKNQGAASVKDRKKKDSKSVKKELSPVPGEKKPQRLSVEIEDEGAPKYISAAEYERREQLKARFGEELKAMIGRRIHFIVFKLGEEEYAIEISKTKEVVVTPPINRAPHTPEYIRGVTNIRGSVVMAMDLVRKFHLGNGEEESAPGYIMVLNHKRHKVGVLIREVPVTLVVDGKAISPSEGILTDDSIHQTYIKGVIKEKGRMIFFVDVDELLESDKAHVLPEETKATQVK